MASRQLLLQRLAALGARANRLPPPKSTGLRAVRCFSQNPRNGSDGDDERDSSDSGNGNDNPFERLLQHSAQFRKQMAEHEAWPQADEPRKHAAVEDDSEENEDDDTSSSSSSDSSSDSDSSSSSDSDSDSDDDFSSHRSSRRGTRNDRRTSSSVHERDERAIRAMRSVRRRVLHPLDDELDYEHGLSNPQHASAKERKFQQMLHREQDKHRVCRNCGERGHVAKHCLLPFICANCGGVGHLSRDCIYPDYTHDDGDVAAILRRQGVEQTEERAAEKQRVGKRYAKFQEDFAAEIDEYLVRSAALSERRRKNNGEKKTTTTKTTTKKTKTKTTTTFEPSQEFKPVIG